MKLLSAVLLVVSVQIANAQDFTVKMKESDGKTSVYYVSRNAVRNVSSSPIETDVIYRLDAGKIITVDNKQKTYSETTLAEARQKQNNQESSSATGRAGIGKLGINPGAVSLTKVGPGETIAGYATGEVLRENTFEPGRNLGFAGTGIAAWLLRHGNDIDWRTGRWLATLFNSMKSQQVRGFLLKMVMSSANPALKGITSTRVATSIEKAPIPASTFEPPAGYRKVARTP